MIGAGVREQMTEHQTAIIKRLPAEVIARIAAGEMITRPAAAVKELVENALDAGTSQIKLEVTESLDRSFRISDDGHGMNREELSLALERYTTSKLAREEDLLSITTLGFRGEALASIAEIGRITVLTKSAEEEHAWELKAEAGEIGEIRAGARGQGTTITVEDLFFNTPVRKRFLKTGAGEMRLVKQSLTAYSLTAPGVSWYLEHDGRKLLDLAPAHDLKTRLRQIHGNKLADGLIEINWRNAEFSVRGVVGIPELARGGTQHQTFFVNGRWIVAPWISQALRRGFGDLIPNHQNPWAVLFLVVPPGQVDVNLHPTKREVHFLDERRMFGMIQQAVQQAVAKLLPRFFLGSDDPVSPPPVSSGTGKLTDSAASQSRLPGIGGGARGGSFDGIEETVRLYGPQSPSADTMPGLDPPGTAASISPVGAPDEACGDLVALWQLHNRYVLAQTRKGLMVIDQHAAHERILYEKIRARLVSGDSGAQQLLFPVIVELELDQMALFRNISNHLVQMGFDVEEFAERSVLVRGLPPLWRARSEAELLRDLLDEAASMGLREGETVEGLARSFACKAAIKSGEPLCVEEMNKLVDSLFATERPHGDPHGRPTFVFISLRDLDQRFGRG
jgi:DNA mismatch repair protein MutL